MSKEFKTNHIVQLLLVSLVLLFSYGSYLRFLNWIHNKMYMKEYTALIDRTTVNATAGGVPVRIFQKQDKLDEYNNYLKVLNERYPLY